MTYWVCNKCGNTDEFEGTKIVKKEVEQTIRFKGEDEDDFDILYEEEMDEEDWEGVSDVKCYECESEECEELSDSEYAKWQEEHFNDEGDYFEEELTSEQRSLTTEELRVLLDL